MIHIIEDWIHMLTRSRIASAVCASLLTATCVAVPLSSSATALETSTNVGDKVARLTNGSASINLAGDDAVQAAIAAGGDELVAEITLPSGTVVTVGATLDDTRTPDTLAKAALTELSSSLEATPSVIEKTTSNEALISSDSQRSESDSEALAGLAASPDPLTFTEIRDNSRPNAEVLASLAQADAGIESGVVQAKAGDPKWWPQLFQAMSYQNSSGRVGKLAFYWSAAAKDELISYARSTFEPDFVTYNYDDKHYFGSGITSWSTTMPAGYKDTSKFDSNDERTYTVGTSDAKKIKSGVTYQTVFITAAGNATWDTGKVIAQRGQHIVGCTSTWCIFAKGYARYFKQWSMVIPQASSWLSSGASYEQG